MEVKELGHLVLYVRDLETSAHFYRDVLGWQPILDSGDGRRLPAMAFNSSSHRTHHELLLIEVGQQALPLPLGRRVGLYHFGLKIGASDDDLREALERLRESGAKVVGATDHGMTHSHYIEDPDGNEIELYIDVPGVDWNDPALWETPTLNDCYSEFSPLSENPRVLVAISRGAAGHVEGVAANT